MTDTTSGFEIFAEWSAQSGKDVPEITWQKWQSLRAPFSIGWAHLEALAHERSGGAFDRGAYDFEAVVGDSDKETGAGAGAAGAGGDAGPAGSDTPTLDMFARYVWVERVSAVMDRIDYALLDRQAFNARNWRVGDPADNKKCAWAVFMRNGFQRRTVRSLTYRPGGEAFIHEAEGLCFNIWRAGEPLQGDGPVEAADIQPWLSHLAYLVPVAEERSVLLDWMAWVAQNPAEKPNWGVLLGGAHGIGKSTLIEPLRAALGRHNVREIGPTDLASGYTDWLAETKLLVVEEMHSFERKETMQRLKGFLAAPPYTLRVNPKYGKQFEVPNLLAGIFFTNHADALALEKGDRRFYVLWSDAEPRADDYYRGFLEWSRAAGGAQLVARWLLARDVSAFDAKGRAPTTAAKESMRKETRTPLIEWVEDSIEDGRAPFDRDLVLVDDVVRSAPEYVRYKGQAPSPNKVAKALSGAGGRRVSEKIRIPGVDGARNIWAVRRVEIYAGEGDESLRSMFVKQRDAAGERGLKDAFG